MPRKSVKSVNESVNYSTKKFKKDKDIIDIESDSSPEKSKKKAKISKSPIL